MKPFSLALAARLSVPARKPSLAVRLPFRSFPPRLAAASRLVVFTAALLGTLPWALSQNAEDYTMFHYNRQRNGWKSNEIILTPSPVSSGDFGETWNSQPFASFNSSPPHVYASPLYMDSVTLTGGVYSGSTFSVVYAATSNGDVYAVSAAATGVVPAGTILWRTHLADPEGNGNDGGIPRGILGTPIINDSVTPGVIYVVTDASSARWEAFALNITNGAILSGWPVNINNSTIAPVLKNGPAQFDASSSESQHGALNLSADNSKLYVPFGGYGDDAPGFLVVISTSSPAVISAFAGAPSGNQSGQPFGGMWAEAGAALDSAGRIYVTTGNTPINSNQTPGYWGQSLLVFNSTLPLSLAGTYTPWNYPSMDVNDTDLCGSGVNVLPPLPGLNPNIVAFGGKQGNAYLVDRDHLPGSVAQRPPTDLTPDEDPSLLSPVLEPYYGNRIGPLNVFGPYSENSNNANYAKSRTTPAYFQTAAGVNYLVHTGATKAGIGNPNVIPPCVARLLINTSPSFHTYLSIDGTENTLKFLSPGSPIVTSNTASAFLSWNLDANVYRTDPLSTSQPYLVAVEPLTMTTMFQSAVGTLHPGGKYNEPGSGRGQIFVGTDRLQTFGLSANIIAIDSGGVGAGNDPLTGTVFVADTDFTGGTTSSTGHVITTTRVTHPAPAEVYQTARTAAAGMGFTYTIPNLKAGRPYDVRLHFCDFASTAAGQRKFNVAINGTTVLTNYDVFAASSGQYFAIAEPFGAVASVTGSITVAFTSGTAGGPIVNGIEVRAPTLKFEAESLTVAQFSGPDHRNYADASQSAGQASILDSNAVGNYITYLIPSLPSGSYDIRVGYKAFSTRGIFQLAIGAPNGAPTNVGPPVDEYSPTAAYIEADLGNWSASAITTGSKWFRFTVTGKNASSTDYTETFDYIKLIPK